MQQIVASPAPAVLPAETVPPSLETFFVIAAPHPFTGERVRGHVPCGTSLAAVIEDLQPDPRLRSWALVSVDGETVLPEAWETRFPAPDARVAILVLPPGGGNAAGWVAVALQVALSVTAIAVGIVTVNPFLVASGVIGLAGAGYTAYSVATAPTIPQLSNEPAPRSGTLAATGIHNRANPWGPVPRILGKHRAVPPFAALPYTEVSGGNVYLRVIFALAFGPVRIEAMKIGETALEEFDEIETEFRRGYLASQIAIKGAWDASLGVFPSRPAFGETWTVTTGGTVGGVVWHAGQTITFNGLGAPYESSSWDADQQKDISLYPADVHQEDLNIPLTQAAGWQTITSEVNADELSIDITFPRGILGIKKKDGDKQGFTVAFEVRYAPTGTEDWTDLGTLSVTGKQQDPLYWGHHWTVDRSAEANGQFDVAIRRITADQPSDSREWFLESYWTALRTVTSESPVSFPGLALLAMRVKPTELAHGTLDQFSCTLTSIAKAWSGGVWSYRPTNDPAALYRAILQLAPGTTLSDDQIDLTRLEEWSEFCAAKGLAFNAYVDWELSRKEAMALVAAAGRAYPTLRNGLKRSVAIDEPKADIVQVFSPVNSRDYSGQILFPKTPHGYRIAFANEQANYKPDERIVYADGYDAGSATDIEGLDFVGVTDPDQIWKNGRFTWAQKTRRRSVHVWHADVEALVCEPFDRVKLSHDTISVGLGAGRIKDLTIADDQVLAVTLDLAATREAGKSYALQVRSASHGILTLALAEGAGTTHVLALLTPVAVATGPAVGDVAIFGEAGKETIDLLIQAIEPQANLTARITAIPYAPEIHNADQGELPPWASTVASDTLPAPVVTSLRSDAAVMLVGPSGTLQARVVFTLGAVPSVQDLRVSIAQRVSGTGAPWKLSTLQSRTPATVAIVDVEDRESYDFRLQFTAADRRASPPTIVSGYTVTSREGPPPGLSEVSIAAAGNAALLRWKPIDALDIRFGGHVAFRHSPLTSGASWSNSVSIGAAAKGSDDHAWLPLKAGTYLARVFDANGRGAETVNSVTTRQASVLAFTDVTTLQEDPDFPGTKTNVKVVDGKLELAAPETIDDCPDWDAIADFDQAGSAALTEGTYRFAAGIDLGAVRRVRVIGTIEMAIANVYDLIDDRTDPIDTWPDMDGVDGAPCDAALWAKITDDDPNGADPQWSESLRLDTNELVCRTIGAIELRLSTSDPTYTIQVSQLRLKVDEVL